MLRIHSRSLRVMLKAVVILAVPGTVRVRAGTLLDEHFGVTLQLGQKQWDSKQHAYTYPFNLDSLVPTKNTTSADYAVSDWYGAWSKTRLNHYRTVWGEHPAGDEPYDVEAMYFDDDPENLYVAVVTSFPLPPGLVETRADDRRIVTGDLALDLGLNSPAADGFRYDYGINVNHEIRTDGDAQFNGGTVGTELYRTANSDWYLGSPSGSAAGDGEMSNIDPADDDFTGTFLGNVQVNAYEYTFPDGKQENGFPTYVIEATISRSLLAGLDPGDSVGVTWLPGCRNGIGQFVGDINSQAVPEPATLILLLAGGASLFAGRRLRKRNAT